MEEQVKVNSLRAWLLASRPKTLTGAAVPVMMGLALALYDSGAGHPFRIVPAVLCLLFAFIMQIDANFVNDYFDFKKGTDDEFRLGPRRACAQGWITLGAMRRGLAVTTALACCVGLPLVYYGGWSMVAIGVLCVVFCFLYTTSLSYLGLGDVLVLVFFGIIPVTITYFLQMHSVSWPVVAASVACGLVIDTLLIVNNYRDRDGDRRAGKRTLVVRIGARATEWLYLCLGLAACLLGALFCFYGRYATFLVPLFYLPLHVSTWRELKTINHGRRLNAILGKNARNMFVFGLLFVVGVLIDWAVR